ncbi:MAG: hypothetical protein P8X79_13025, partial [Reinekea sp.]
NFNEPMGAPAIFEKQIEIKLLHPASTLESRIQVSVFMELVSLWFRKMRTPTVMCCSGTKANIDSG